MKKEILAAVTLLTASQFAAASGLGIDNVEQHMNADNWVTTQTTAQEIVVQAPVDAFVNAPRGEKVIVDRNVLQQSYDGQS